VNTWRSTHGVDANDPRPLGEPPQPSAGRAQFDSLAARLHTAQHEWTRGIGITL
jgi:hypothetical protein